MKSIQLNQILVISLLISGLAGCGSESQENNQKDNPGFGPSIPLEPTASPNPSVSPSPTELPNPSTTPSVTASPSPTALPNPSATPSVTASPSPTISPSENPSVETNILTQGLENPWGMAFLPDGRLIVTERPGRLRLISFSDTNPPTAQVSASISGLPSNIAAIGQGGLLDVALHPQFEQNSLVYLTYAGSNSQGLYGTELARGKLQNNQLTDVEVLFRMERKTETTHHYGSRVIFDRDGFLYMTMGDRGEDSRSQDLNDHAGSIVRLTLNGDIPSDNPFVGQPNIKPEIYSYGHRSPQGATVHPQTGEVWMTEHGPQGGDELNVIKSGANYGWPVITYGVNYGSGTPIGEGTSKPGMEQPVHYWTPSIATSGVIFYNGSVFPEWRGDAFVGALKYELIAHLEFENGKVIKEERLFTNQFGRIRDIEEGPDGLIYFITDESNGSLIQIAPKSAQ
ncbi:MAG: PQQ-dependent sugar dehydrogenase [Pseudomonadota bacterium]